MNQKVTVSISEHITENFKALKVPFFKVADLVKSKFNYSAGVFKNNYRNKDNYLCYSDLIILDIDDGMTIKEAKEMFLAYDYIISTTKSHQKEKNGIICDRFRVVLPTENPITLDKEQYSKMMEEVYKEYPFVDTVCKDASRFYFPAQNAEVYTHQGFCNFDWEYYWDKAKENDKVYEEVRRRKEQLNSAFKQNQEYTNNLTKADYYRKIAKTEKLLQLLKFDEKFVSGRRNHALYSWSRHFKEEIGLTDEETKELILWVNNQGDSISEQEIEKTIFKSLRLN